MYEVTTASAPSMTPDRETPRRPSVSETVTTFRSGANRSASVAQFASTEVGATIRKGLDRTVPGDSGPRTSFACWISASVCSVLPSPMSSARTPPRPFAHRKASHWKPDSWYGRSCAQIDAGIGAASISADVEQPADLALPRGRLVADLAQGGQLLPQPGLEPADPQGAVGLVLQRPRLVDEPGEGGELGLVEREVRAVGQQQVRLAARQRDEQLGERDLAALDGDVDAEVEPVRVARRARRPTPRSPASPRPRGSRAPARSPPGAHRRGRTAAAAPRW